MAYKQMNLLQIILAAVGFVLFVVVVIIPVTYWMGRVWTKGKLDETEQFAKTQKWSHKEKP